MVVLRTAALIIGIGGFVALYVLLHFYPAFPRSVAGWLAVFLVALPFLMAMEWAGSIIFGPRSLAKLSPPVRISLGVLIMLAILAVTLPIAGVIARLINS